MPKTDDARRLSQGSGVGTNRMCRRAAVLSIVAVLWAVGPVTAQVIQGGGDDGGAETRPQANAEPQPLTFDSIWKFADWYENDDNSVIQSLQFSGRFQLDYTVVDADQGHHTEWNIRRFRFGAKAKLFQNFTLHGEVEVNPQEADPVLTRITDMYFQWNRSERFNATIGKHSAPFTMDGSTSSKELLTIDRNNLTNNMWFTQEYLPGVSVSGDSDNWSYRAGAYTTGAADRGFGDFNGSVFGLVVVGHDFAPRLGVKEAVLAANYVYQDPDEDNSFTRNLENILSVNFKLDTGKLGIRTDLAVATGFADQSDLWGTMAMPFYNATDKLQLVGRYTFVASKNVNGVRLNRYESQLVSGDGDRYHEIYVGLNYDAYGHKLKLQGGIEFADMRDRAADGGAYSGVAGTAGFRMSW